MTSSDLFEVLVKNTGLPEAYVRVRLERLICDNGGDVHTLNLEQVRELLSSLLLELIEDCQREPA